jgi:hypothetical protein
MLLKEMSLCVLKIVGQVGESSCFLLQQVVGTVTTKFEKFEIYVNCNNILDKLLSEFLVI